MTNRRRYFGLLAIVLAFVLVAVFMGGSLARRAATAVASAPVTPLTPLVDGTESLPPGTTIETLLSNMTFPIAMAFDPAGRLFYTEKTTGNVRLFSGGVLQPSPVINYSVDSCSERGLLGIAIDPNFNVNHYIYVYYTAWPGSSCGSTTNRVARFVESGGVGSGSVDIFTSTQTAGNHNGGNIHFGADGKLYISIGDNANSANSQNVTVKNGKMHRINSDGTIPSDNPVFTQTGALGSLYAVGLRNTFDFTFDPIVPTRIFASENGPSCDDELNRIEAGYNYGWRTSYPCDDGAPSPTYNTIPPLWYLPSGLCCPASVGIVVYTGTQIPQWTNHLFMETFNNGSGVLRHHYLDNTRTVLTQTNVVSGVVVGTDIENGPDGALWYIQGGGYVAGTLKRIVASGVTTTPTITPTRTYTNTPTNTPTPACPANVVQNDIVDFAFVPMTMTINVGTSVRWTNYDLDYHTATSDNPLFDSGNIQQNQSYTFTFDTPGTYGYYCIPHPFMRGAIVVLAGCAPVTSTPTSTLTPTLTPTFTNTPTATPNVGTMLVGHVTWQGRPAQPNVLQQLPLTLTLKLGLGASSTYIATTDSYGFYTVTLGGLPTGAYSWRVKNPQTLATGGSVSIVVGASTAEMGTQPMGDANNDNCDTVVDFGIVKNSFGTGLGDPSYDSRADFSGDNAITIPDFNLLRANFGFCGASPLVPGASK